MRARLGFLGLLLLVGVGVAGHAIAEKPRGLPLEPQAIEIAARPLRAFRPSEPERTRFGALEWIGGLELTSRFRGFGGLSGIAFRDAEGRRLLAISDAGIWLAAELTTEGERPVAVREARMAPMRDAQGRSVAGTWRGDAESLALAGGYAYVGFEATNEVRRFPLAPDVLTASPELVPTPSGVRELRRSRGLEALAAFPDRTRHAGAFLAVAESPTRRETWHRAWILGGAGAGALRIVHRDDFHVTDAAVLPSGDALLLERRVDLPFGVWVRIRRIAGEALRAGASVDGAVIFEADLGHAIDNLEGMAIHRGADGATYVTLVSDDNYSLWQRTLLLRFRLAE